METKEALRSAVLQKRKALSPDGCKRNSERIAERLFSLPAFRKAQQLYAYLDFRGEVQTRFIIETAWRMGKQVALPRCGKKGQMTFYAVPAWNHVGPGAYGILEPEETLPVCVPENGVMLVPAVAFDRSGNRLGYGGGYYDRYVSASREMLYIGLAHELQIVDALPVEAHDRKVDIIITEERIYDGFENHRRGCQAGSLFSE